MKGYINLTISDGKEKDQGIITGVVHIERINPVGALRIIHALSGALDLDDEDIMAYAAMRQTGIASMVLDIEEEHIDCSEED